MSLWTHGLAAAAAVGVAGTGANDSSSSSSSALARSLHQAPHYNLKFKPVSHQFAPEDREYLEALIQMMWPVALVATLLLLRCDLPWIASEGVFFFSVLFDAQCSCVACSYQRTDCVPVLPPATAEEAAHHHAAGPLLHQAL